MEKEMFRGTCHVSLTLGESQNLLPLLSSSSQRSFWFSWILFDKPYQSRAFSLDELAHTHTDTLTGTHTGTHTQGEGGTLFSLSERTTVTCEYDYRPVSMSAVVPKEVTSQFPLQLLLCAEGEVLACALLHPEGLLQNRFPVRCDEWLSLLAVSHSVRESERDAARVRVRLSLEREEDMEQEEEDEEEEEEEEYAEDGFEDEHKENNNENNTNTDNNEEREEEIEERELRVSPLPPPPPPPPATLSPSPEDAELAEHALRHFRLSLELQSLRGLSRPAHLFLQCTYAHLGVHRVVRTPPQWYRAHVETQITRGKGALSYECATTRARLQEIFAQHPLKILLKERTPLGSATIASVSLSLSAVLALPPHLYRCALTHKTFSTRKEYDTHRQALFVAYQRGESDAMPPKEPEIVRALDSLFALDVEDDVESNTNNNNNTTTTAAAVTERRAALAAMLQKARLRMLVVLEDKGVVGREMATRIQRGYRMHNGAVYNLSEDETDGERDGEMVTEGEEDRDLDRSHFSPSPTRTQTQIRSPTHALSTADTQLVDWELWRQEQEREWRNSLHDRELALRQKIKEEAAQMLEGKVDDLRRAQVEVGKLEVRLKAALEAAERQRTKLLHQEELLQSRASQKMQEVQLLAKRVKAEARTAMETEQQKSKALESQLLALQDSLRVTERRALAAEKDFESLKQQLRHSSEAMLREELALTKAQLAECREAVEREKNLRAEVLLEKEHFRAQMHRLAVALKREREKSAVMARQELEQLRLEFLAREERYVLDGDRNMLHSIKSDLAQLKQYSPYS